MILFKFCATSYYGGKFAEYDMKLVEELQKDEVQMLIKQIHLISWKWWIKSVNKGSGSIGYTFEMKLGKLLDSLSLPDYYGT